MVLCTVKSGIWSPACHRGVSHNCRQGAAAPRSVGPCNRASQKGLYCPPPPSRRCRASVPETLPGPGPRTLWTLMPSLSVPQLTCYRALHGLSKRHRLADGIHISPKSQPGTGSPGPGAGSLRSGLGIPHLTVRSPVVRCGRQAGSFALPGAPAPPALRKWPGAVAWTSSRPSALPGAAGPVREGRHICMRPAARERRGGGRAAPPPPPPRGPGWPGRVGGWALLSRAARSRLVSPQAEPPSPAPSVSLPCSRRGRSDLQRSRGARSNRLGAAPPGPGDGGGRGCFPPAWAPRQCQVRAPAPEQGSGIRGGAAGGPQPGGLRRGALRGWEPAADSLLPRSASFPSPLAPLSLFLLSISLHPSFPACLPSLSLPSISQPFPHPLVLFPSPLPLCLFLSLPFSPFSFLLSFPSLSSPLPAILFPTPLSPSFSPPHPAFSLVPSFPPASPFPREQRDCQVCVCSEGGGAEATAT